ncbi:MAG TPA: polysaccharide deacetylase family protein [Gemmatimonadaceae bacterium]|nr:polysaccharide deacetylase family protein [Gemmatimonadaceae bacterium]
MSSHRNLVTVDLDATTEESAAEAALIADGVLDALARSGTTATFFASRKIAETSPALASRISNAGHEVGCLTHSQPARSRPYSREFSHELEVTRSAIEDATGVRVRGHRNAHFAVDYASEWAYDVLVDQGFEYDSSRIPPRHVELGYQPVPRSVHAVRRWGGTLLEVPVSTTDVLAMRMRLGTTGSVRGIPLAVWGALVEARQERGEPLVMHLRASELRRQSPFRRQAPAVDRRTLERMSGIVGRFPFTSVAKALPELLRNAQVIES